MNSYDVLIVGAGPAGMVAAITLAGYGADVLVVERRTTISHLPRATGITTRTMEILRAWGLEPEVRAGAAEVSPLGWVSQTLASADGVEVELGYPSDADAARWSPTRPAWAPQDHVEPILRRHLAAQATAELRTGVALVGLQQHHDGVRASLRSETGAEQTIEAAWVIGADGIRSTVRQLARIAFAGSPALEEREVVLFRASLEDVIGERRYALNLIRHPTAEGVVMPMGRVDRWAYARAPVPGRVRFSKLGEAGLRSLLATATGVTDLRPRFEHVGEVTFGAQIADRYRQGRAFLVGDAAHRMTPRGGTGMNTAIHDAFDLGWKLGWVLRSWAGEELLDSYESERRPIGVVNTERSARDDGSEREAEDGVRADLNGRVRHLWIDREHGLSTIDLLGAGTTVLCRRGEVVAAERAAAGSGRAPVSVREIEGAVAQALDIAPGDALALRPDGRPGAHLRLKDRGGDPDAALAMRA